MMPGTPAKPPASNALSTSWRKPLQLDAGSIREDDRARARFDVAMAARELVDRSTREQGLPRHIQDPAAVARLAALVRLTRPSRQRAA